VTNAAKVRLAALADAVLLPCFDGTIAPDWLRRRVAGSLGGVCLFGRNIVDPEQVAAMTASLAAERESVVVAIDEEAGDVTRLDAATGSRFPGAAALGQVDDVRVTGEIAAEVGRLLADAGVSVNFAPCADVAVDPSNPVIGSRAFGADTNLVARHTAAWVTGQQAAGVAACAKHFPGHGDTDADTHRQLAVLNGDLLTLRAQAIPPFVAAIHAGVASIMAGHLLAPAVDDVPASVSHRWLTEILRGEMGFDGAVVTDALEMAAVADSYGIPGAAVAALAAGADLLCIGGDTRPPQELDGIRDAIVDAVLTGTLTEQRLADAAARSATLGISATRRLAGRAGPVGDIRPASADTVHAAARRALVVAGPLPELRDPVLVLRCTDTPNIAVGAVPWGPATALDGAHEVLLRAGDEAPIDRARQAGSVLVVTRDRHRHPWMVADLNRIRQARPDAVLVEMGISGVADGDGPAVASFGATLAASRAVVEQLGR